MKALIITKPTNLEQHGEVVKAQIKRQQLEVLHLEDLEQAHDEHYVCMETVKDKLVKAGIDFEVLSRSDVWDESLEYDVVVSVGGDGTLLSASHWIENTTPVIGIRSSRSSVGYLCAGDISHLDAILSKFQNDELSFVDCARLRAEIYHTEKHTFEMTVPALNDFLFANLYPSATSRYRITVGDESEAHKSSGIWVSTATGSTAGIRAAGGQAMTRDDGRFQYLVRELYQNPGESCSLINGFFDPDASRLLIENLSESAILAVDGQRDVINLKFGDRIDFKRAPSIRIALPIDRV